MSRARQARQWWAWHDETHDHAPPPYSSMAEADAACAAWVAGASSVGPVVDVAPLTDACPACGSSSPWRCGCFECTACGAWCAAEYHARGSDPPLCVSCARDFDTREPQDSDGEPPVSLAERQQQAHRQKREGRR